MISEILFRLSVFPKSYDNKKVVNKILDEKLCVTFINPLAYSLVKASPEYKKTLSRFDVLLADGGLLAWFASRVRRTKIDRRSFDGNSLAPLVFKEASDRGLKIALIGSEPGVADRAASIINLDYPDLVSCSHHGFFPEEEITEVVESAGSPDVVVLAMGAPRQDRLALAIKQSFPDMAVFTCGGYLDQIVEAGGQQYYPEWISTLNLRAPYRLIKEPRRLARRYFVEYFLFYLSVARFALFKRLG